MREDFAKVLVERPRRGHKDPARRAPYRGDETTVLARDPDEFRGFESSSRGRGGSKYLNENLGPLRRFLGSSVGRPWNDVHAELCEHIRGGNAVQRHVLEHLYDYVKVHIERVDGVPYEVGERRPLQSWQRHWTFYVCPETQRLLRAPRVRRRPRPAPVPYCWLDPSTQLRMVNDVWFRVQFAPLPAWPAGTSARDLLLGVIRLGSYDDAGRLAKAYGARDRYAYRLQQVGRRELRELALRGGQPRLWPANDPERRVSRWAFVRAD